MALKKRIWQKAHMPGTCEVGRCLIIQHPLFWFKKPRFYMLFSQLVKSGQDVVGTQGPYPSRNMQVI